MYRFVCCQTHPKCPDVIGWYLVLEPSDTDTLFKLHKGVSHLYFCKFGLDPHIIKSDTAIFYHPVRLAAGWLRSVEKLLEDGPLFVNSNGGLLPSKNNVTVLSESTNEKMEWPDFHDDEVITISRWPEGKHFYLSSNKDRIFMPPSYVKYEDAHRAAKHYTNHIKAKGC